MSSSQQVEQAIELIKTGQKAQGREVLKGVLEKDRDNARGWAALSQIANTNAEAVSYLQEVLRIKPGNEWAANQLARMENQTPQQNEPVPQSQQDSGVSLSEMEKATIRQKSYIGPAVLVFVLYLVGYIPGLVANVLYYNEAKKNEKLIGEKLYGSNVLRGMLMVLFWIPIPIILISGIIFGILLITGIIR